MGQNHFINTDETLEVACIIKAICDEYDVNSDDLVTLPTADELINLNNKTRFKRRISVKIPIPFELAPKSQKSETYLNLCKGRPIENDDYHETTMDKLGTGLGEFEIQEDDQKIQFWAWNGTGDYYITGGRDAYFVRKQDLFSFIRTLKRWEKNESKKIDTPILPTEMLVEIYNNTVGFLIKGKEKKEQYSKYKIPYKRGVLLCGRPGCVTGDTKIKIRKKSNKGTHKIYDVDNASDNICSSKTT